VLRAVVVVEHTRVGEDLTTNLKQGKGNGTAHFKKCKQFTRT